MMLSFQSRAIELKYRAYFNVQHFYNDRPALAIGIIVGIYTMLRVRASQTLWIPRGPFYLLVILEKVIHAYFILAQPSMFIRHRTLVLSALRIVNMVSGDMYCSFWASDVDLTKPARFYGIALGNGGNIICLLFWAIFNITPSGWYLGLQLLHVAKCFYEAPKSVERLQPYLHHLTPLKNWVHRSPVTLLLHPSDLSERTLLLYIWAVLRVLVGLVLPCSFVYRCQLQSRRLWRYAELKRTEERRSMDGNESAANVQEGMKLLPVWKLYLPHMVIALIVAAVSGHDAKLLALMF
ncbi:hypothetical protein COCOBI_18-1520 [Coccomyxa sp. Obi]|nr:hypothetical protein COCOBI_18-1520 [Coccomyxa sp. Obi]